MLRIRFLDRFPDGRGKHGEPWGGIIIRIIIRKVIV